MIAYAMIAALAVLVFVTVTGSLNSFHGPRRTR